MHAINAAGATFASSFVKIRQDFFVAGSCLNSSNKGIPGFWKNGTWTRLGNGVTGDDNLNSDVRTIFIKLIIVKHN